MEGSKMTQSNPRTDNTIQIMLTTAERAALKDAKGDRTYGKIVLDIKSGILEPIQLPDSAYDSVRIYTTISAFPTNEQAAALNAEAQRRGIPVGKLLRSDIFVLPESAKVSVKDSRLHLHNYVTKPVRDVLASLRATDEFEYMALWTEHKAFVEIAAVLMRERLTQE